MRINVGGSPIGRIFGKRSSMLRLTRVLIISRQVAAKCAAGHAGISAHFRGAFSPMTARTFDVIHPCMIWVGTSGFQYPEWKGKFYPEKFSPKKMLAFYSEHFNSTESNY